MNKIENDKLISLIVYKLKDTLLNLMYDMIDNPTEDISNSPTKILEYEDKVRDLYTQLADYIDKDITERTEFTDKLNALEKEIVAAAVNLNKYTCINNQLGEYIFREMKLIEVSAIEENIPLNNSGMVSRVEHYLTHLGNNIEDAFAKGELLACLPLRMTKAKYRDYIKTAFGVMVNELPPEFAASSMDRLKDMSYVNCMDIMKEDFPLMAETISEIYKLPVSEFNKDNIEEYMGIVDDNIHNLSNAYAVLGILYNDITYMRVLTDYVIDTDFIFDDDFVLKDLYYSISEGIKEDDNSLYDTISERLSSEIEQRFEQSKNLESDVSKAIDSIKDINELDESIKISINVNNAISNAYLDDIDQQIMLGNSSTKSNEELAEELCEYIEDAVKDLPIPRQKYIKQRFLQHLPCGMSNAEIVDYTNYSLSGVNDRAISLMACSDLFSVMDKVEKEAHSHEHHHHHHEHCDCGHEHHHDHCDCGHHH